MSDIEERLRNLSKQISFDNSYATMSVRRMLREAADEIMILRARVAGPHFMRAAIAEIKRLQADAKSQKPRQKRRVSNQVSNSVVRLDTQRRKQK